MAISYRKLREILVDRQIQKRILHIEANLSNDVIAKIDKDEYMSLESLERIARYLGVDIGDLVELK